MKLNVWMCGYVISGNENMCCKMKLLKNQKKKKNSIYANMWKSHSRKDAKRIDDPIKDQCRATILGKH